MNAPWAEQHMQRRSPTPHNHLLQVALEVGDLHHDLLLGPGHQLGGPLHRFSHAGTGELLTVRDAIGQVVASLPRRPVHLPQDGADLKPLLLRQWPQGRIALCLLDLRNLCDILLHGVVELKSLRVLLLESATKLLPSVSGLSMLSELESLVEGVPYLLCRLITRVPGVVHVDGHHGS